MSSSRTITRPHNEDRLLDAALDSVMAVGLRRTTLTDVARRAEVSRMTAYRAFPDLDSLVRALMTREFGSLIADVGADVASLATARERLVESVVLACERLPGHPLFRRVLDVDPELLLPYLTRRLGATQRGAVALFAGLLEQGATDGSVRDLDTTVAATQLLLLVQSQVLASGILTEEIGSPVVAAELRLMLDRYLRP